MFTIRRPKRVIAAVMVAATLLYGFYTIWWVFPRGEPLATKATAPEFSLPDSEGASVSLSALVRNGPAVLVFYRGHW